MDDEMVSKIFKDSSKDDLIIHCNIVSDLPAEYDYISKVSEAEDEMGTVKAASQKPLCYHVMSNGVIEEKRLCSRN